MYVNVERGAPSAIPKAGDVWRLKLPQKILLNRERVLKILEVNNDRVKMMEVPFSSLTVEYSIIELTWIEKISQE